MIPEQQGLPNSTRHLQGSKVKRGIRYLPGSPTRFYKEDVMMPSTDTKARSSMLLTIGVVASFIGAVVWIPLGLVISLATLVFAVKSQRFRSRRSFGPLVLVIVMFLLTGGYVYALYSSGPHNAIERGRVQDAFHWISASVSQQEGLPLLDLTPVRSGTASFSDGTKASLWVTNPASLGIRSHCFYVDMITSRSASGYSEAACGQPGKDVSLEHIGIGPSVIGYIGIWPARTVFVTANGATTRLPITHGYFILPGKMSGDLNAKFTITLMNKNDESLMTVTDLLVTGSTTLYRVSLD